MNLENVFNKTRIVWSIVSLPISIIFGALIYLGVDEMLRVVNITNTPFFITYIFTIIIAYLIGYIMDYLTENSYNKYLVYGLKIILVLSAILCFLLIRTFSA